MQLPKRWNRTSWEDKARQNPLLAVQTTEDMLDAPASGFTPEQIESLLARGRRLFAERIAPLLAESGASPAEALVVEYGCGVGRILKAIAGASWRCAGIDISETMIAHARVLAPEAEALHVLDGAGRSGMPDGAAAVVFSYAVVQHIRTLSACVAALDEMCRVLQPGGLLAVHLNCEDFTSVPPGRTENQEDRSLHFHAGEDTPYWEHVQDDWSGVYIGRDTLTALLAARGVAVDRWFSHNPEKPRGVWVVGRKAA